MLLNHLSEEPLACPLGETPGTKITLNSRSLMQRRLIEAIDSSAERAQNLEIHRRSGVHSTSSPVGAVRVRGRCMASRQAVIAVCKARHMTSIDIDSDLFHHERSQRGYVKDTVHVPRWRKRMSRRRRVNIVLNTSWFRSKVAAISNVRTPPGKFAV